MSRESRRQGIDPSNPDETGKIRPTSESERVQEQIERGEVDTSAEAAREIARRIEDEGGFWGPRKEQ